MADDVSAGGATSSASRELMTEKLDEICDRLTRIERALSRARASETCKRCTARFVSKGEPFPDGLCWRCWLHPEAPVRRQAPTVKVIR